MNSLNPESRPIVQSSVQAPSPTSALAAPAIDPISRTVVDVAQQQLEHLENSYSERMVLPPQSALRRHLEREYLSKGYTYMHVPDEGICGAVAAWINYLRAPKGHAPLNAGNIRRILAGYLANNSDCSQEEIAKKLMEVWDLFKSTLHTEKETNELVASMKSREILEFLPTHISNQLQFTAVEYFNALSEEQQEKAINEMRLNFKNFALPLYIERIGSNDPVADRFVLWAFSQKFKLPVSAWIEYEDTFYSIDYGSANEELNTFHLIQHHNSYSILLPPRNP